MSDSTDAARPGEPTDRALLLPLVEESFRERDWVLRPCVVCRRVTLVKRRGPQLPCCQRYGRGPCPPPPRRRPTAREVWARIQSFLGARALPLDPPLPVLNRRRDTIFTVAGMQMFQPTIEDGRPPRPGLRAVAQPCVRLRHADEIPDPAGMSTAFVNLCTEEFNASTATYMRHFDLWIDLCSTLGLHANFMVLSFAPTFRPHPGDSLEFVWCGIELGEGIWNNIAPHHGDPAFTDFGFGFDRLVWAATRSQNYYENIGPTRSYPLRFVRTLDRLRTAALLLGSGLEPGPRDAGFQLRKLLRSFAQETPHFDFRAPLAQFLAEWNWFATLPVGIHRCIRVMDEELRRHHTSDGWDGETPSHATTPEVG